MASCKIQESQRQDKTFQKLHDLGMNDDLWDRVRGLYTTIYINDMKKPIHSIQSNSNMLYIIIHKVPKTNLAVGMEIKGVTKCRRPMKRWNVTEHRPIVWQ